MKNLSISLSVLHLCFMVFLAPSKADSHNTFFLDASLDLGLSEEILPQRHNSYGAFWIDFNSDGWLDLVFMNHGASIGFYQNVSGKGFKNIFKSSGIRHKLWLYPHQDDRHGGSCSDFDNDGDDDIFIAHGAQRGNPNPNKSDELLLNQGGRGFVDIAHHANIPNQNGRSRIGAFIDYNNDGLLDLYTTSFETPNALFQAQGGGIFRQHDIGLNIASPRTAWSDFNNDGYLDVALGWPFRLYQNIKGRKFKDVTGKQGLPILQNNNTLGMIMTWGDYDNDGDPDLFIAGRTKHPLSGIYRNNHGSFVRAPFRFSLEQEEKSIEAKWGDVDNDGDLDLLLSSTKQLRLYLNEATETFTEHVIKNKAHAPPGTGGNLAFGDFNNDGYLDIATNSIFDGKRRHLLFKNERQGNEWIKLSFRGKESNRNGIGVKVIVTHSEKKIEIRRQYIAGFSQGGRSASCGPMHIGLGSAGQVDLDIIWPSGQRDKITNINSRQHILVTEGNNPYKE